MANMAEALVAQLYRQDVTAANSGQGLMPLLQRCRLGLSNQHTVRETGLYECMLLVYILYSQQQWH